MSTVAKILVVLNLVLAVAFLASASSYLGNQDTWHRKYDQLMKDKDVEIKTLKGQLDQSTAEKANLTRQANEAMIAKQAAETEASRARSENDMLREAARQSAATATANSRALEAAQSTITANQAQIAELQQARQTLTQAIEAANDAKDAAVRNLNSLQVAQQSLTAEKEELQKRFDDVTKELERTQFAYETIKAKVPDAEGVLAQPSQQGRILAADNDANVVVISLGAEDGVKEGFEYRVSRGASYVGRIRITNVESKKSAGRSIRDLQKSPIQVGDLITSK